MFAAEVTFGTIEEAPAVRPGETVEQPGAAGRVELVDAAAVLDDPAVIASARRRTPGAVVIVTGAGDHEDVQRLLDAGADAVVCGRPSAAARDQAVAAILAVYGR